MAVVAGPKKWPSLVNCTMHMASHLRRHEKLLGQMATFFPIQIAWPELVAGPAPATAGSAAEGHLRRLPQIRTCPIKAYGSSDSGLASRRVTCAGYGDSHSEGRPPQRFPDTAPEPTPPFPPQGPRGVGSPASTVL